MVQINTSGEENKNGLGKNKFARCIYEVLTYPYISNNTNLLIMIFLDEKEGISCAKYIKEQCHNLKLLGMLLLHVLISHNVPVASNLIVRLSYFQKA